MTATAHAGSWQTEVMARAGWPSQGGRGGTPLCLGPGAKGLGPAGAEPAVETTDGQFPSTNTKTCTDELNMSNKMTLQKVSATKKETQAVLCWRFLLHMALRACAVSVQSLPDKDKHQGGHQRRRFRAGEARAEEEVGGPRPVPQVLGGEAWTGAEKRPPPATTVALTGPRR